MDPHLLGWIGGITGSMIGVMGGIIGSVYGVRSTRGPRERAFAIRATILCWILVCLLIGAFIATPRPYAYFLWIPYGIALPLLVMMWNRRQLELRREDEAEQS